MSTDTTSRMYSDRSTRQQTIRPHVIRAAVMVYDSKVVQTRTNEHA